MAEQRLAPGDETTDLIRVIRDYADGLDLIDAYAHQRVDISEVSEAPGEPIDCQDAHRAIDKLRIQYGAGDLFGREKDESLQGSFEESMIHF